MEHFFSCPYCAEEISFLIDTSVPQQTYVEDCEVCCRPIEVSVEASEDNVTSFVASSSD
ncbi:MAG: CPXCG motif-containing cysteine-rich protein [Rhodothermales bacterium]|nr:CPXCG motif-containing cysteine-rich protein [Rhodothermales bacterium]